MHDGNAETQTEGSVCDITDLKCICVHSAKWDEKPGKAQQIPKYFIFIVDCLFLLGQVASWPHTAAVYNLGPRPRLARYTKMQQENT